MTSLKAAVATLRFTPKLLDSVEGRQRARMFLGRSAEVFEAI
jgi:hypothetical protein